MQKLTFKDRKKEEEDSGESTDCDSGDFTQAGYDSDEECLPLLSIGDIKKGMKYEIQHKHYSVKLSAFKVK